MRQVAWLTAIPRVKDSKGLEQKLPARIEPYKALKADPPLPDVTAKHVFDWLMEIGPAEAAGMGQAPISWREIDAWAARTFQRPSAFKPTEILLRRKPPSQTTCLIQARRNSGNCER